MEVGPLVNELQLSKFCSRCKTDKILDEFYPHKAGKYGVNNWCKICSKENHKIWAADNREHRNEYNRNRRKNNISGCLDKEREYKAINKDKLYSQNKEWKKANPEKVAIVERRSLLKTRYGMSLSDYDDLLASQNNSCAICKGNKRMVIDHCHKTNKVRGILCNTCNRGIGLLQDRVEILQSAISYLKQD